MTNKEALLIIWDRCQHSKETEEAIEVLKKEHSHGAWIPCTDRLPEKDGKYLVTKRGYISQKPEITTSIYVSTTKEFYPDCIAWMPLPDPYKPEGGAAE